MDSHSPLRNEWSLFTLRDFSFAPSSLLVFLEPLLTSHYGRLCKFFVDYYTFRDLCSSGSLVKLFWKCNTKCIGENWKCTELGKPFLCKKCNLQKEWEVYNMFGILLLCFLQSLLYTVNSLISRCVMLVGMTSIDAYVIPGSHGGKFRLHCVVYVRVWFMSVYYITPALALLSSPYFGTSQLK